MDGHGPCTQPCTRPYTAVYGPCTSSLHDGVHGRQGTARTPPWTRSCTRIHGLYTKPIEFATFSQLKLVIASVNKAKHHTAGHRKFIQYVVKNGTGIKILYLGLLTGLIRCHTTYTEIGLGLGEKNKNSSGDEIASLKFYAVRPEPTRIRWNNAK